MYLIWPRFYHHRLLKSYNHMDIIRILFLHISLDWTIVNSHMNIHVAKLWICLIATLNGTFVWLFLRMRPQVLKELEYTIEHFSAWSVHTYYYKTLLIRFNLFLNEFVHHILFAEGLETGVLLRSLEMATRNYLYLPTWERFTDFDRHFGAWINQQFAKPLIRTPVEILCFQNFLHLFTKSFCRTFWKELILVGSPYDVCWVRYCYWYLRLYLNVFRLSF